MKTLHRYKKVIRNTLLSIITASFFVVSSALPASASTYEYRYISNDIRGMASAARDTTADYYVYNTTNKYYRTVIEVSWDHNITGTFKLGLAMMSGTSDTILCEGCVVKAYTSTTLIEFECSDVNHCRIEVYSLSDQRGLSSFTGTWSSAADLDTINTTLGQIKAYVDGVETSLNNIYSRLGAINTSISLTNSILDQIANIVKINSFPVWQQNALFWANKMGTLQFDKQAPYFYYDSSLNTGAPSNPKRIKIDPNKTVSLIFYCDVNVTNSNYHIYGSQVSNVTTTRSISSIVPTYPLYLIRLDFTSSHTASVFISIEFDNSFNLYPLFLGDSKMIPDDIHILFGTDYDNTYTRLLNQMINAIGTISQNQIIENNTNINNYNNYQQQINNVENNYYQEFNTYENNIENNNTFDFTGLSTDGVQVYHNLFSNLYGISLVKWPVLITLLGLVIVIILG